MDRLWLRMAEIYGHKWVSQYGSSPLKTWAVRLGSLSREQIGHGVNACAHSNMDWPPSLPEFCALCQPDASSLGLPDIESAFQECMRCSHEPSSHRFSHEAVRLAAETVGWYVLRRCLPSEQEVRKRFASAYGAMIGKVQRGEPLSAPLEAIGSDADKSPAELAAEKSERDAFEQVRKQGLAGKTGDQSRKALLESLGIRR